MIHVPAQVFLRKFLGTCVRLVCGSVWLFCLHGHPSARALEMHDSASTSSMYASASTLLKEDLIVEIAGLHQAVGNAQVQYHRGQGILLAQASAAGLLISDEVNERAIESRHVQLDADLTIECERISRSAGPENVRALLDLTERLGAAHTKACSPGECWVDVSGCAVEHVQMLVDAGIAERQPDGYQLIRIAF